MTTEALTDLAMDVTADKTANDPKHIVKNRLTERTQAVCPDIAGVVLR